MYLCFVERPAKSTESYGSHVEHHGEKRENYVDQKGSGGPEEIRGKCQFNERHVCTRRQRELTADLTLLHRETCVRCAHLLLPLPQGRRWSLRVNQRNHHRTFVTSYFSVLPGVFVDSLETSMFWFSLTFDSLEMDTRSSLRRCCPTESWITSRWKSGWLRSVAAGRGYRWRRRTATRRLPRRSRGSTKSS